MSERPKDLPKLDAVRLAEIRNLLTHESSISFQSGRAHESMWVLYETAVRVLSGVADQLRVAKVLHEHYYDASWSSEHQGFRCVCGWLGDSHVVHVTELIVELIRPESTVKAEALREAATAARADAANSRTRQGHAEATTYADWLDDRATEIDPARLEGAHP